mmetsp:Transcript_26349/g.23262  ORF Transcript_26349/g.23262 Transcript_26349/m.23262 type:complete len:129 (+) Transcript_26349:1123-1509(+)
MSGIESPPTNQKVANPTNIFQRTTSANSSKKNSGGLFSGSNKTNLFGNSKNAGLPKNIPKNMSPSDAADNQLSIISMLMNNKKSSQSHYHSGPSSPLPPNLSGNRKGSGGSGGGSGGNGVFFNNNGGG